MHKTPNPRSPKPGVPNHKRAATPAAAIVLDLARRLHRAATSDSPSASLPVLRRLLQTNSIRDFALPELYRQRDLVQRKHVLRTLAVEAGFTRWERYRSALETMTPEQLTHFELAGSRAGYPNVWFSSHAEASAFAHEHGGHAMPVGKQGVVLQ